MVTSKFKKITTYNSIVKITIAYGVETWEFKKKIRAKIYVDGNRFFFLGDRRDGVE